MVGPNDEIVQWTGVVPSRPGTLTLELTDRGGRQSYLLVNGEDVTELLLQCRDAARAQRMESMSGRNT